jgi:ADP-ribose pyrophosphatase YjhB (NUDIX family)
MNAKNDEFLPPQITLCVGAVVLRERKVLFVRQTYGSLKGVWSMPWGFVDGKKPDGAIEPPDMAVIRETQEEAGVIAKVEGLLGVQNHSSSYEEPRLYIIFLCRHMSGEPTPDNKETDKAAYFSLNEIENFDEPFDNFCRWMAIRVLRDQHHVIPLESSNPYQPHSAYL